MKAKFFIILMLSMLLASVFTAECTAAGIYCIYCKKPMAAKYRGSSVCPQCATVAKCNNCKKYIDGKKYLYQNNYYCSQTCAEASQKNTVPTTQSHYTVNTEPVPAKQTSGSGPVPPEIISCNCGWCGKPVKGNVYSRNGKNYCGSCIGSIPVIKVSQNEPETSSSRNNVIIKCRDCKRIIRTGRYFAAGNDIICGECYNQKTASAETKCELCGSRIRGYSYKTDSGKKCCESCRSTFSQCKNCPAALDDRTGNPGNLCRNCTNSVIVSDLPSLLAVWSDAKKAITATLGIVVTFDNGNLILQDSLTLKGKEVSGYADNKGTIKTVNGKSSVSSSHKIYIKKGMSKAEAFAVMCHEYAHVWVAQQNYKNYKNASTKDRILNEGFAEWVAYKCCNARNLPEECQRHLENPDPVYGEGLRKMLRLEQRLGSINGVLNYMKTNTSFPDNI